VFHPASFAGISDLPLNQVAEGDIVSALHRYMRSRADGRASNSPIGSGKTKKKPRREGRGVQSGELTTDQ
jgi:hypothetical protein